MMFRFALRSRLILLAVLLVVASAPAAAQFFPSPGYENSRFIFVDPSWISASDADFQVTAATILGKMPGGTYARPGLTAFLIIDMPWAYDSAAPTLTNPSYATLVAAISRAQASGLAVHFQTIAGISRAIYLYDGARLEDRRNCQWYSDNLLEGPPNPAVGEPVWMTPSRYARKLRRHLETKTRLWATMLVSLRQEFPNSLQSASGDGESELNSGRVDDTAPYSQQIIADYSPFTILEFRDWIQHAGLYAPGQFYSGQGYPGGGTQYQGPTGLSIFNSTYGTAFTSWNLRYFDWSLDDPVDGDSRSISAAAYEAPGWNPMPSSGPDFILSGFDAPRAWNVPTAAYWQLWLQFRQAVVNHYALDFSSWITTTTDGAGNFIEPSRWYSHQIPADYLFGKSPADPQPYARLLTSASTMRTALVHPTGSLGLTSFDLYFGRATPPFYMRTSQYLFPDLVALNLPNWGLVEYSPSWAQDVDPATGAPVCDPDVSGISSHVDAAFDAGAHVLVLNNWPLCTDTTISSFGLSLDGHKNTPRTGSTWWEPAPPAPQGLQGSWFSATIRLAWSDQVYGGSGPTWSTWGHLSRFEVWRGANPGFTTADGNLVASSVTSSVAGIPPDTSRPFYKVLAVNLGGLRGALSAAVRPPPPPDPGTALVLDPIPSPVVVGSSLSLFGSSFTAGSRIMVFVATSSGPVAFGPYTPSSWSNVSLVWLVDPAMSLGNGYAAFMVVNTDQGYIQSNTQSQLLYGDPTRNIPTIIAVNGVGLRPADPTIPTANVETVVTQGTTVTLTGTGFSNTLVNLFTAAGNKGPLTPLAGATSTQIQVVVPADTPTGPGSFQAVNSPYTGNVLSNAVSVPIGSLVTISHVSLSGNVVTVTGTGFCSLTVINLFAETASGAQNLGGLNGSGTSLIPLTIDSSTQFHFTRPAAALAGAAYVMAINPPFIAYSSSGVGPSGGFLFP
jgi:hypothetical protein